MKWKWLFKSDCLKTTIIEVTVWLKLEGIFGDHVVQLSALSRISASGFSSGFSGTVPILLDSV